MPLALIVEENSSILTKTISALAIGILSLISLGAYAVYAYCYFADRNVKNLHRELQEAVKQQNYERAKELLEKTPRLKEFLEQEKIEINSLKLAITNQDLRMIELLLENGASPNANHEGKSAVDSAILNGNVDILKMLIDHGGFVEGNYSSKLYDAIKYDMPNRWDILKFLIEKVSKVNMEYERSASALALIAQDYDKDPVKCTEVLHMMLQKGAKLIERDNLDKIPPAALKIIEGR